NQELINFKNRYQLDKAILGNIITKNFSLEEHYFLINKGSRSGVKKDMIAIYKFQIIGKVIQVFNWYSKILLITDHKSKISAFTNNTNAPGIVVGNNQINKYEMIYTSHLYKIEKDDFIISSGKGLIFPEGFCLGKIQKHSKQGIYHKIEIVPLIDFKNIEYCLLTNQEKLNAF
ncbi:rod shape-determining protein MreC, partial [Candidatus Dependentiae bacterium]